MSGSSLALASGLAIRVTARGLRARAREEYNLQQSRFTEGAFMYVLEYLCDPRCEKNPEDTLTSEYRLLCSGTIFRDVCGDPDKSEVARILLDEPLKLFAASRPLY